MKASEQVANLERENERLRDALRNPHTNLYICLDGRTWMDNRMYPTNTIEFARAPRSLSAAWYEATDPVKMMPIERETYYRRGKIGPYMVWEQVR